MAINVKNNKQIPSPVSPVSPKTEQITIRVSATEKATAEELANYLFKVGKLTEPTLAGAFRLSLRYTVNQILKAIEVERYAG